MVTHTRTTVHPECNALTGLGECSCDKEFDYVDESIAAELRAIEIAERLESQNRTTRYVDKGADADEADQLIYRSTSRGNIGDAARQDSAELVERGFWKDSEDRKCKAGLPFRNGDLDMRRFQGYTWRCTAEAMK